jgi:hypothetical protein
VEPFWVGSGVMFGFVAGDFVVGILVVAGVCRIGSVKGLGCRWGI